MTIDSPLAPPEGVLNSTRPGQKNKTPGQGNKFLRLTDAAGPPEVHAATPQHFLYFLPLPQGQGSLRPTFGASRRTVLPGSFTWPV